MHRSVITALVLTAFAASAVFGLCAMTQEMMMHGGLCADNGIGSMVCPENPIRHVGLLASLFAVVAVAISFVLADSISVDGALLSAPRWRERTLLNWAFSPGLQPLFSDGLLNPKTF